MILKEATPELVKACRIAAQVRDYGAELVKSGTSLLEITERLEQRIKQLGGSPAFPPQISLNHIAAHNCPDSGDTTLLKDDLVKIDIGVHVNGYIGDTARTVDLSGRYAKLVEAANAALDAAVKLAKPGVEVRELGRAIQSEITKRGFSPIRNLSGHGLGLFEVHTSPTIPNYDDNSHRRLEKGELIAIEPFATNGVGIVQEGNYPTLFSLVDDGRKSVRLPKSREVLKFIATHYGKLVFAKRWLKAHFKPYEVEFAIRMLLKAGLLRGYPPLGEQQKGMVAQAEHTVLVWNPPMVLTRNE
ncbi:type II methionyl aminopeptidase [Candidatus Woesearchaeota archaeon]|nr:type II methionyl aminopeptidase [Candidatus Woesearchaeota archaeon]RLE43735.1 MAG: type II methionyl aminopeptidase [Candidatus Woesearchaeota archaeon]